MTQQEQMAGFGAGEVGKVAELAPVRKRQGQNIVGKGKLAMAAKKSRQDPHDGNSLEQARSIEHT